MLIILPKAGEMWIPIKAPSFFTRQNSIFIFIFKHVRIDIYIDMSGKKTNEICGNELIKLLALSASLNSRISNNIICMNSNFEFNWFYIVHWDRIVFCCCWKFGIFKLFILLYYWSISVSKCKRTQRTNTIRELQQFQIQPILFLKKSNNVNMTAGAKIRCDCKIYKQAGCFFVVFENCIVVGSKIINIITAWIALLLQ